MAHTSAKSQGRTLPVATHHYEAWSPSEVELVLAFTDEATDEEIAITLGRSLYAVWNLQHRLKVGAFDFAAMRDIARRSATTTRPQCGVCFTEIPTAGTCGVC